MKILSGADVQVGRPDPDLAPAGYRAMLTLRLAERYYRAPGLADRLLQNAPRRNMRANAAELAALLQLGELDYIYDYESVAESNGFQYVRLPRAIDLSDPALARVYGEVNVRVRGTAGVGSAPGRDSVTFTGQPIVFALSVPGAAPHKSAGQRLAGFLLSVEGRRMLRAAHLNVLDAPVLVGDSIPQDIRASVGR
jgi:molybdate/tungstate transport system substrate-binding protein